ncbi:MAG: flippase-like domain-containing protein [Candidatus Aenigmarchaeota archaeon]|nr:flippase-like domain-containing protein [Candidatus Aenigmarchaeota archaeon]
MNKIALMLVGSIIALGILLQQMVGFGEVWGVLSGLHPVFIPFILFLPFSVIIAYSFRWKILLQSVDVDVKHSVVFKYALLGTVFNNLTPMVRFGGEPVKGYMLSKKISAPKRKIFASLAMDSLITLISLIGLVYLSAVSLAMLSIFDWFTLWMILTVVLVPLTIGLYTLYDERALVYVAWKISGLLKRFRVKSAKGLPHEMLRFRDNMKRSFRRKELMGKSLLIAAFERSIEVVTIYIIFNALGVNIDIYTCAVVLGVGIMAGNVPLLPGGILAYESSTILVLGMLGVPFAQAASGILLWRFASYWVVTIVGITASWIYGIKFSFKKENTFKAGVSRLIS